MTILIFLSLLLPLFVLPPSAAWVSNVSLLVDGRSRKQQSSLHGDVTSSSSGSETDNNEADALKEFLRTSQQNSAPTWLKDHSSLPFACTECGKCCQTQGYVHLSPPEVADAAAFLQIEPADFIQTYASHRFDTDDGKKTWIRLKEKASEECIFLNEMGQCSIYGARPIQCRTYPFWPQILSSKNDWDAECRRQDDDLESSLPAWTPEEGGCEGMQRIDGKSVDEGVPMETVLQMLNAYEEQDRRLCRDLKLADSE